VFQQGHSSADKRGPTTESDKGFRGYRTRSAGQIFPGEGRILANRPRFFAVAASAGPGSWEEHRGHLHVVDAYFRDVRVPDLDEVWLPRHETGVARRVADVSWESASMPRRTIPRERLFPLEGPDGPRVAEAFLNGTGWSDAFRRRLAGRAGTTAPAYGVAAQWHAIETPLLTWAGIDQVTLRFDRPVNVDAADLVVSGSTTGAYPVSAFQYDEGTRVATWTLGRELSPRDRVQEGAATRF
jgi:hypothetical protein